MVTSAEIGSSNSEKSVQGLARGGRITAVRVCVWLTAVGQGRSQGGGGLFIENSSNEGGLERER